MIEAAVSQGMQTAVITFNHSPNCNRKVPEITCHELKEKEFSALGADVTAYLEFSEVRDMSPKEFIEMLTSWFDVKFISCGFNYRFGKNAQAGSDELSRICAEKGIRTRSIEPVTIDGIPVSSTRIRSFIANGDMSGAAALLGRPFAFYGEIIHGRHLGHTLGMPTINQQFSKIQILPRYGVYASVVHIADKKWPGVTNVGVKPTVARDGAAGVETFIPGFEGNLYGEKLKVDIIKFIRPEMKFGGIEELKAQMQKDTANALETINNMK